ncbi:pyrroline-5-carboxylate reductase [Candidatus Peregrinibacteria bacterium]|nr:pyrroline-5-carboxylate reductase [Candidatus Peregrinibacteria bacterium]
MKIGIIGGGNMGSAFAKGLRKNLKGACVVISDKKHAGKKIVESNIAAARNADVLILAVKPQDLAECLRGLRGAISKNCIVISIAAGVKVNKISRLLRHKFVCRVMPNLLATIGKSISTWYAPGFNAGQKLIVKNILRAVGEEIGVKSDDYIDKASCISGCGPAYVWYFMENLIKAGVSLGLTEAVSRKLTSQTFLGAAKMGTGVAERDGGIKNLRLAVTSKKGTTEQAIKIFEKKKMPAIFSAAVKAAYKRTKELSK